MALVTPVKKYSWNPRKKLYSAAEKVDLEAVKQALAAGASGQNAYRDGSRKTALHIAANRGNVDIVHSLLQANFDPREEDKHGLTPLDEAEYWAVETVCPNIQRNIQRCRDLLVAYGGQRGNKEAVVRQRQKLQRRRPSDWQAPWHEDLGVLCQRYQPMMFDPYWSPAALTSGDSQGLIPGRQDNVTLQALPTLMPQDFVFVEEMGKYHCNELQ